jgi:hypothetical protein
MSSVTNTIFHRLYFMKLITKAFPVLFFQFGNAQTPTDYTARKIEFGSASSTFAGSSFNYISNNFLEKKNIYAYVPVHQPSVVYANFGWKQGLFMWVNLNEHISYKTQIDLVFGVTQYKYISDKQNTYCKFLGLEYKPQLIIKMGCCDKEPVIKMARNMSYYLTKRQSYLIVGPKWTYRRSDKNFLKNNSERSYSIGGVFGIGVDNLFPNLEVAPELIASVEYQTGNLHEKQKGSNRYYASLSLVMNFF